jgi:hypothetical protein
VFGRVTCCYTSFRQNGHLHVVTPFSRLFCLTCCYTLFRQIGPIYMLLHLIPLFRPKYMLIHLPLLFLFTILHAKILHPFFPFLPFFHADTPLIFPALLSFHAETLLFCHFRCYLFQITLSLCQKSRFIIT